MPFAQQLVAVGVAGVAFGGTGFAGLHAAETAVGVELALDPQAASAAARATNVSTNLLFIVNLPLNQPYDSN